MCRGCPFPAERRVNGDVRGIARVGPYDTLLGESEAAVNGVLRRPTWPPHNWEGQAGPNEGHGT